MTTKAKAGWSRPGARGAILRGLLMGSTILTALPALAQEQDLGTIYLERQQSAEEAGGPVEGYVAQRSGSATKSDTPIAETPVSISVVTADQITDQDAGSVAEALRYTPGVFSEYRGTSNLHDETSIRGLGDRAFAPKYLDGLTIGSASMGQLDPYYLERVEVVKGPASLTYGQVVPGGVITQFSKRPTEAGGNEVVLSLGSDDYARVSADLQGDLDEAGRLSYRLVASAWKKTLQDDLEQNRVLFAPSLTWEASEATKVTLTALYQNEPDAGWRGFLPLSGTLEPTEIGLEIDKDFLSYAPDYDNVERETWALGYEVEHEFENGMTLNHRLRGTSIDATQQGVGLWSHVSDDGSSFPLYVFENSDDVEQLAVDTYLSGEFATGGAEHSWLAGFDYLYSHSDASYARDDGATFTFDFADKDYITSAEANSVSLDAYTSATETTLRQTGIYLQDQIEIGNWRVLLGGRYDWTETTIDDSYAASWGSGSSNDSYEAEAFSGRAALAYRFDNGVMPYLSYSTSFEPVTELDDDGDASFEPTRGKQWETGVKWASSDGNVLLTAALFDIVKDNILETDTVAGVSETKQIGEIRSRGFELEAHAKVNDRLSVMAGYSKADPTYETGEYEGNQLHVTPLETASLWMKYALVDGLDMSLGLRHMGKTWGDQENTIELPDYTLVDLGLSADLGQFSDSYEGLRARINVSNVTDERYVTSCAFGRYCWFGEGRTVTASLSYEW